MTFSPLLDGLYLAAAAALFVALAAAVVWSRSAASSPATRPA
jgi:hypothetical protein